MQYERIEEAVFINRPNRFIAETRQGDRTVICHVKNTGRCRELLVPDAPVYIQKSDNPARKTGYDLISVWKKTADGSGRLINMDSQAPNVIVKELLEEGRLLSGVRLIRPETRYKDSRFDFYVETENEKCFIEVKGVTLEEDGLARFPDAPTERGVRHLEELCECVREGYRAMLCFVIQMKGVYAVCANGHTHPEFARALSEAAKNGVEIRAFDCLATGELLKADQEIPVMTDFSAGFTVPLRELTQPLLTWFRGNARVLPWREDVTPYRVWISEIMLQQTRVEAVKPYFDRFVAEIPDVAHLAAAADDRLMKLWEGLGYYSRARNLKKAAQMVMETCGGSLPEDYDGLKRLPGIGSYTAGAVASIGCGQPYPAVDGNVLRVWSRIYERGEDVGKPSTKAFAEREFRTVIPKDCPGEYNQAWMELGATVCVPNGAPHCDQCPLAFACRSKIDGCAADYPKKSGKKERKIEKRTVFVLWNGAETVIRKRPPKGLLAGLYELPNSEGFFTREEALRKVKGMGFLPIRIRPLPEAKHIFSHVEWHMCGYFVLVEESEPCPDTAGEDGREIFVSPDELGSVYSIPSAFRAYREAIPEAGSKGKSNWKIKKKQL